MGTGMEKNNRSFGSVLERRSHASEVKTLSLFREVGITLDGEVDIREDLVVVCPCRVGNIDCFRTRIEFREEKSAEMDSASA